MSKKNTALFIDPSNKSMSLRDRNIDDSLIGVHVNWEVACICNSERRRLEQQKSHADVSPFFAGHEGVGIINDNFGSEEMVVLLPHSNCLTRGVDNGEQCIHCKMGQYNLCTEMRHAGLDAKTPSTLAHYSKVPTSQLKVVRNLQPEQAVFLEPLSCVHHSWKKIQNLTTYKKNSNVLIVGGGPIGCMHAIYASKVLGLNASILEKNIQRQKVLTKIFAGDESVTILRDVHFAQQYDVAVMAASTNSSYRSCVESVVAHGHVLLFSGFNIKEFKDEDFLPEIIHRNEFVFIGGNKILVGSSGYINKDIDETVTFIGDLKLEKLLITGVVNGIDSKKLIQSNGDIEEFNEEVIFLDMRAELMNHIKIIYRP